ncbi:hypothetical protein QR680_014666 [Steinernema hermaphroditum]|uniref:Uncharacterized protein n=1 Tax=Steinernema hermaphroditum TaxID=289476 RepID=A0AA39M4G8_9BILA|nr:hypothetical protein QR680_014666 [Steinernema hermaphroditum]
MNTVAFCFLLLIATGYACQPLATPPEQQQTAVEQATAKLTQATQDADAKDMELKGLKPEYDMKKAAAGPIKATIMGLQKKIDAAKANKELMDAKTAKTTADTEKQDADTAVMNLQTMIAGAATNAEKIPLQTMLADAQEEQTKKNEAAMKAAMLVTEKQTAFDAVKNDLDATKTQAELEAEKTAAEMMIDPVVKKYEDGLVELQALRDAQQAAQLELDDAKANQ